MHNERMHEALCRLYPDAPAGAWELSCGPSTDWVIAITKWNLSDPPPTQEILDAEYAAMDAIVIPEPVETELLDLNTISYAQADAIIKASTVEELRFAVLDVLGL